MCTYSDSGRGIGSWLLAIAAALYSFRPNLSVNCTGRRYELVPGPRLVVTADEVASNRIWCEVIGFPGCKVQRQTAPAWGPLP